MGKFSVHRRSDGLYYFNLKAGNGEIILSSEGYTSKTGCLNGIASVKINSEYDSRYEKRIGSGDLHYFILKATNGEIIGVSEKYSSQQARDNGIQAVKNTAPSAPINDMTI